MEKGNTTLLIIIIILLVAILGFILYNNSKKSSQGTTDTNTDLIQDNNVNPTITEDVQPVINQQINQDTRDVAVVTLQDTNNKGKLIGTTFITIPNFEETVLLEQEYTNWGDYENQQDVYGYIYIGELVKQVEPQGYLVGTLEVNAGGNSNLVYLALFVPGENAWEMSSSVVLDNEADVTSIVVDGDRVVVDYYTYGSGQSQAELPNTKVKKHVKIMGTTLGGV